MDSAPQQLPEPPPAPEPAHRISIAAIRPRAVVMVIVIAVTVAALLWLLWLSKRIISWVLIAMFLAVALNPIVNAIQRHLRFRRVPAIALTFLLGLLVAAGIAFLFVPPLIDAGQQLAHDAPGYVDRLSQTSLFKDLDQRYDISTQLKDFVNTLPDRLGGAGTAVDVARRLLSGLVGGLTVAVLTFMFLIYGRELRTRGVALLPLSRQARVRNVLDQFSTSISGYVQGNLLVSIIAGVTAYIALKALGVPAAAVLAFWVAITDLVPLVGATVGAIPAVAVAFFSGWPIGVGITCYFLVYQQVENHFIQPVVMRRTTSLNPLLTLVAVLVGAELLGILGALLGIPVASMIKIVATDLWEHRRAARAEAATPTEPPPDAAPTP